MATSFLPLLRILAAYTAAVATNMSPQAPASAPALAPAPAPAPSVPSSAADNFLRASCAATDLPGACYSSLLPYADSFHGSLARVARAGAGVAAARQHDFVDELARLKAAGTGAGPKADAVLADCFVSAADSDLSANETLGHLDRLVAGVGSRNQFDMERFWAQEWLGTAESGMADCTDWFHKAGKGAASSPAGQKVIAGCTNVSSYMHIALMLTNAIKF